MFTDSIWAWIAVTVAAYLLGAFSGGIFTSLTFFKKDLRNYGSANAGLTNAIRNFGWQAGAVTGVIDMLKALAALFLAVWLVGPYGAIAAGGAVCIGHAYPVYYGFKGGKSATCSLAIIAFICWQAALVSMALFAALVLLTRKVSLGSILGALLAPFGVWFFMPDELPYILFVAALALFITFLHRSNIKRILAGVEHEAWKKKS